MAAVSSATEVDATLLAPTRFTLGFMKSVDNRRVLPGYEASAILTEAAFGHAGLGGSLGFADPEARMSFGYTMNAHGRGIVINDRAQALVDAVYRSLGYTSNETGSWLR
jgi:CubicO group peptidase (beta-lactamase class C family)